MVAPTHPDDVERLGFSPTEFAAMWGCSRQHVQNLIARGELRSVKLGRKRLIPRSVVDEMLAGGPDAPRDAA